WTNVRQAGAPALPGGGLALEDLLQRYRPALRAHLVYKKRPPPDRADDLGQDFIHQKFLGRNVPSLADPRKGMFRTFLLSGLGRAAIACWRKERATAPAAEPPSAAGTPGPDVFDVAWAMSVLAESLRRMRAECESKRRQDLWGVFT